MRPLRALAMSFLFVLRPFAEAAPPEVPAFTSNGPFGAWVTVLAVDPATRTLYAGTLGSGVFRSADGARTWTELPRNPYHARVAALAIDPTNPRVLLFSETDGAVHRTADGGLTWDESKGIPGYVGTLRFHPAGGSVWAAGEEGVFVSPDSGVSFRTALSVTRVGSPSALAIDPSLPGHVWAGGAEGLFRTRDGGKTWAAVRDTGRGILSVVLDPKNPSFVAVHGQELLFTSRDQGKSWSSRPLPRSTGTTALMVDPGPPRRFVAVRQAQIVESTDDGATWNDIGSSVAAREPYGNLVQDPADGAVFYAPSRVGVLKSEDGGRSWNLRTRGMTGLWVHSVAIDPKAGTIYAATRWGRFSSLDGGRSWQRIDPSRHDVRGIAVDPTTPDTVYSATAVDDMDLAPPALLRSRLSFGSLDDRAGTAPEQGYTCVVVDPIDPQVVWAGSVRGLRKSTDGGATWPSAGLENEEIAAVAVDPSDGAVVLAAARQGGVFRSADGGTTWSEGAPELKGKEPSGIAFASGKPSVAFVATQGSGLFRSSDHGITWTRVTTLPYDFLRAVLVSPDGREVVVGSNGKGLFASRDGGATWAEVNRGLAALSVTSLARDPKRGLLVVGTTKGVFVRPSR